MSSLDRLYAHYVAAANWLILAVTFTGGVLLFDQASVRYMLITVLFALALGNAVIYFQGLANYRARQSKLDYDRLRRQMLDELRAELDAETVDDLVDDAIEDGDHEVDR